MLFSRCFYQFVQTLFMVERIFNSSTKFRSRYTAFSTLPFSELTTSHRLELNWNLRLEHGIHSPCYNQFLFFFFFLFRKIRHVPTAIAKSLSGRRTTLKCVIYTYIFIPMLCMYEIPAIFRIPLIYPLRVHEFCCQTSPISVNWLTNEIRPLKRLD